MNKQSSEISLPSSKLMLLDLDKTLIDPNYQITDSGVMDEIARAQSLGWQIGLSSDTPLDALKDWRRRFGMNGPIVAERGAIVWLPDGRELVVHEAEEFFTGLRQTLITDLVRKRASFVHGDVTQLLRINPSLPDMTDPRLILIQAHRRCSLTFYGRKIDKDGQLTIDNDLVKDLVSVTRNSIEVPPFDLLEDYNPEYGIYILSPKSVDKRSGTLRLMESLGIAIVGMIGDSSSDVVGKDIAYHYAVGNAKPELRATAEYTSLALYTAGVVDILQQIT